MPQASSEVAVHAPAMSARSTGVDAAPVHCFALQASKCFSIVGLLTRSALVRCAHCRLGFDRPVAEGTHGED